MFVSYPKNPKSCAHVAGWFILKVLDLSKSKSQLYWMKPSTRCSTPAIFRHMKCCVRKRLPFAHDGRRSWQVRRPQQMNIFFKKWSRIRIRIPYGKMPKGPYTHRLQTFILKAIPGMDFGTSNADDIWTSWIEVVARRIRCHDSLRFPNPRGIFLDRRRSQAYTLS